eukprot:scaffold219885_cov18-Tisochrysis_lutea.AAC.1
MPCHANTACHAMPILPVRQGQQPRHLYVAKAAWECDLLAPHHHPAPLSSGGQYFIERFKTSQNTLQGTPRQFESLPLWFEILKSLATKVGVTQAMIYKELKSFIQPDSKTLILFNMLMTKRSCGDPLGK